MKILEKMFTAKPNMKIMVKTLMAKPKIMNVQWSIELVHALDTNDEVTPFSVSVTT
jgi:hypothetical protein